MNPFPSTSPARSLRLSLSLVCVLASLSGCGSHDGAEAARPTTLLASTTSAPATALDTALASGDASGVDANVVKQALYDLLNAQNNNYPLLQQSLFANVGALDWNPTHDSVWLTVKDNARNNVMLSGNYRYSDNTPGRNRPLVVVGNTVDAGTRYAVFGGNPIAVPGNAAMEQFMRNTVGWLSARASSGSFKVVTAHLPGTETYWFPHETKVRDWFYANYPGATVNGTAAGTSLPDNKCDGSALAACLQGADLLVISRADSASAYDPAAVLQTVREAQQRGIPVLYLHYYRDHTALTSGLFDWFGLGITNNYFDKEGFKALDPATLPAKLPFQASVKFMLSRIAQANFSTTWSGCTTSGRINCNADTAYMTEFDAPAKQIRTMLRNFDSSGVPLFQQPGYRLEKLLVLHGDKIRRGVSYPIDKSDQARFFRAYFSDMAAYINRGSSAVAQNLGNFAPMIPAATPTLSQTVSTPLPLSGSKEYLTGLYVIPGKPVTVTRTDAGRGTVSFGLNMLRDTTWVFNTLDRPSLISSPRIPLQPNKPVTITSPYGGPLLLFIQAASGDNPAVTVAVDGVITHPLLRNADSPDQVAAFQNAINTTPTNWVGFTTDALTLHSTLPQFKESLNRYHGNLAALAADTMTYTVRNTYELAGFNSASGQLQLAAGAKAVCDAKGWDCTGTQHRRDAMQHVIADVHANCGNGCSGNPYDQDWAFQPLGWGESHEIGHNLQVARLMIYGGQSGEVSNNIFPMHAQMMFNRTAAGIAEPIVARPGAGSGSFSRLKAALGSADPAGAAYTSIWSDPAYAANNTDRVMFYRQLAEYARHYNSQFSEKWEIFTLMYLLNRNMALHASQWPTVAAGYGFGTYASYPSTMDGNDFMLIAASNLIGRDMEPMFKLWGVTTSAAARAQVAAYGLTPAQALFFPMYDVAAPASRVGQPVLMSASAVYPSGY